jgi:pyruvate dehydrogenase E2 component (dihydrolipoamide acetyltransferase)
MAALQELVMPKLGLTMTEGLVAEWKVAPRQSVRQGETLFVVETEKIANEIEAPADGVIEEILVPAGAVVPVGAVLARWSAGASVASPAAPESMPAAAVDGQEAPAASRPSGRVIATPLARRLARERALDLRQVTGSGPRGRVKAKDVLAAQPAAGGGVRATSFEATVARRLAAAKRDVPHFYVASEANVGALLELRDALNEEEGGARVTLTHMLLLALGRALVAMPEANRVWREDGFETFETVDIGIAVDTARGLLVPILRDLGAAPLADVARRAAVLVERARRGELALDDMGGGAVAISNVGMHGVTYLTPIINPGHAAILGVGSVREVFRPGAGGAPELRRELGLVLACDHRVLDGVRAARLLNRTIGYLEKPYRLLAAPGGRQEQWISR